MADHVLWQNFLGPTQVNMIRNTVYAHKDDFVDSTVTTGEKDYRRSKVLWDTYYPHVKDFLLRRIESVAAQATPIFPECPRHKADYELQLTVSGDGDFFNRHTDNSSAVTAYRLLTFVYYFGMRNQLAFSGGELVIEPQTEKPTVITPQHNTLVLFRASACHEIRPVEVPSHRWEDGRMTLNGWIKK